MNQERSAFETATLPLMNNLYRIILRIVHDPDVAANQVVEAYAEASRRFHPRVSAAELRIGLFTILFRKIRQVRPANSTPTSDDPILQVVDRIPVPLRLVLLLRDVEDMSPGDVGRILGLSREAVEVRLSQARSYLRDGVGGGRACVA